MPTITPYIWFDNNLEEALDFYASVFKDAKVTNTVRMPAGGPAPEGALLNAEFELAGQKLIGLNGGPHFKLTEAFSLFITCNGQDEVDYYWNALIANGGEESMCGWLKDRFGLSWQVIPRQLMNALGDADKAGAQRAMQAMLKMRKIIVGDIEKAYQGA